MEAAAFAKFLAGAQMAAKSPFRCQGGRGTLNWLGAQAVRFEEIANRWNCRRQRFQRFAPSPDLSVPAGFTRHAEA